MGFVGRKLAISVSPLINGSPKAEKQTNFVKNDHALHHFHTYKSLSSGLLRYEKVEFLLADYFYILKNVLKLLDVNLIEIFLRFS